MWLSKYLAIAKINFKNEFTYFWDFLFDSVFIAIIIFIYSQLWAILFSTGHYSDISGYTLAMLVWYLVMTESIIDFISYVVDNIGDDIKQGNIANYLNKPYNYIIYIYTIHIVMGFVSLILTFLLGSIVAAVTVGGFSFNFLNIPFILITIFLAMSMNLLIMTFLGLFAFWMEDVSAVNFIYQKFVFIIGGTLIPLEFFPEWLAKISSFLPFSYLAYYPAKLFINFNLHQFLDVVAVQILWCIVFIFLILFIYKKAIKKVSINGG